MKLFFLLLLGGAVFAVSKPAFAPTQTHSYENALRGCLQKIQDTSFTEILIQCAQTGTVFQHLRELRGRGWEVRYLGASEKNSCSRS